MSIFNEDKQNINNNLINEENSDIKIKNDKINELTLEIEEKTTKLNRLDEEIKRKEKEYKEIKDLLNDELSKIENELSQKQAEFDLFNIKLENSVMTDKDEKIKYLEENIKNINNKFINEQKKNIILEENIRKLKGQIKKNEKNESEIHDLAKENEKLSTKLKIFENIIKVKDKEIEYLKKNNKSINDFEDKIDEINDINEINNDINKIETFLNNKISKIEELVNKDKNEGYVSEIINTSERKLNKLMNDNPIYSYECINKDSLVFNIKEGTEKVEIQIELKNNGNIPWNYDTQLKIVNPSDIKIDDITLKQQEPNEINSYKVVFKSNFKIKEYIIRLAFCSDGETYGDIIVIKINILPEIKFYNKYINEFREEFKLPLENYSDERLFNALKDNNFNFSDAFNSFFN